MAPATCLEMTARGYARSIAAMTLVLAATACVRFKDNEFFPAQLDATTNDGGRDAASESESGTNDDGSDATDAPGDGSPVDGRGPESCPQGCEKQGEFKCLDQATVQLCAPAADGCPAWQTVGPCPSGHLCCDGLCVNDDVSLPASCVEPLPAGYDYYVSASVPLDASQGDGSRDNPFRTITKALEAASGRMRSVDNVIKIFVARGTYDEALGEAFPLVVPGGVLLQGAGTALTVITGSHVYDTSARGGAATDVFVLTMVVGDVRLPTTIAGFTVVPGDAAPGSKTHFGVYCDLGAPILAGQSVLSTDPNTTLRDLVIGPRYYAPIVATNPVTTLPACNLRLTRSTILGGQFGLWSRGSAQDTRRFLVLGDIDRTDGGIVFKPDGGNVFKFQSTPDRTGTSLLVAGSVNVAASYNVFTMSDQGATVSTTGSNAYFVQNRFEQLSNYGIKASGYQYMELTNNTFANISMNHFSSGLGGAAGLEITGGRFYYPSITARGNTFFANDTGVRFGQQEPIAALPSSSDFGYMQLGSNQFFCNGVADSVVGDGIGGSVVVDLPDLTINTDFFFQGNRWNGDTPSVTRYKDGVWLRGDVMLRDDHLQFHADNPGAPYGQACPPKPH